MWDDEKGGKTGKEIYVHINVCINTQKQKKVQLKILQNFDLNEKECIAVWSNKMQERGMRK